MNTWNIILKQSNKDLFDVPITSNEKKLIINLEKAGGTEAMLGTNVFTEMHKHKLSYGSDVDDLLNLAMGVYTIDQVVSREHYGFMGWSRHFKLFVTVYEPNKWTPCKGSIEDLLSFLSGDKWEINFRQRNESLKRLKFSFDPNPKKIQKVSLFSGGMDSFVGAVDLLTDKIKVGFVSHYKRGIESSVQARLYQELRKKFGEESFVSYQFYVQPNQNHNDTTKEASSRARSFLFMCLGLGVANSLGKNVDFVIPENGLISLNIPLTGTRLSSHSTRTTHPYYFKMFKDFVSAIGIENQIINPYQFHTKGEMMEQCKDQLLLKKLGPKTLSCSHPDHSRWAGYSPGSHCGYCVPCLIRQAAEMKSRVTGTRYIHNIIKAPPSQTTQSGSDIRAFKLALERMEQKSDISIIFDILSSGPVPFKDESELKKYVNIYKRGMNEVKKLLKM